MKAMETLPGPEIVLPTMPRSRWIRPGSVRLASVIGKADLLVSIELSWAFDESNFTVTLMPLTSRSGVKLTSTVNVFPFETAGTDSSNCVVAYAGAIRLAQMMSASAKMLINRGI